MCQFGITNFEMLNLFEEINDKEVIEETHVCTSIAN